GGAGADLSPARYYYAACHTGGLTRLWGDSSFSVNTLPTIRLGAIHRLHRGGKSDEIEVADGDRRLGAGHRRRTRRVREDAGLFLGRQPREFLSSDQYNGPLVRCLVAADLQPAGRVRAGLHQDRARPRNQLGRDRGWTQLHLPLAQGREVADHEKLQAEPRLQCG